ncbi:hypothetical protein [Mucilaginibacter sp. FT3.2]|uniref:hypothetical protein n=1 Tax=Mucilaginibacter sp. FT3.2 TaxID=2723090 RepID=UPI00160D1030|nr:hypothetical protein [Mucilaginibacter sp. FT3.2]MBB6234351.1 hypothetical protein [Mucilaginibacter sp. FT3.2]
MKLIKISIIAFVMLFSFQHAKAQSISIGASFGYRYPHHRIIVADNYPAYGYYNRPVYYRQPRYCVTHNYYRPAYHRGYYRPYGYHRRW